jgi:hypothetical protein
MGTGIEGLLQELHAQTGVLIANSRALIQRSRRRIMSSLEGLVGRRPRIGGGADPLPKDVTVRQRVRTLLDAGNLPGIRASEIRGGSREELGDCAICNGGISIGDLSFAVPQQTGVAVIVHGRCFSIWTQEAAERVAEP